MEDKHIDIVGYIGAVFLSLLLLPQVYQTYKMKKSDQISYIFVILEILTSITFIIYGVFIDSVPIIVANNISLISGILLGISKIIYKTNTGG